MSYHVYQNLTTKIIAVTPTDFEVYQLLHIITCSTIFFRSIHLMDAQNLRKYELGKQEMKISMLKRIADAFGVSPSELINFNED
ncbi:helix-turn-helix domain-containing protein [Polaribacter septentrionalilitoris]|uniref:helix-turn-helix domain-containing protein n=1 Tax=Polaribacter septentrionalilitoris TaxID=2494657 RepID=UPI00135CC258|nr:helix-turn-helix transcriptional regulator [Polaribacter septentrionalilitoris]